MPILLLFLLAFSSSIANACGKNGCWFFAPTCYTDDDQRCWRCEFGVGLEINKSCKDGISDLGLPGDYNVVGLRYQYRTPTNPFDSGSIAYYMKYAYCDSSWAGKYSNDRCGTTHQSSEFEMDVNNIADSIEDCFKYKKRYTQDIGDQYLKDRVCLVKMSKEEASKHVNLDGDSQSFICAFNTVDKYGKVFDTPSNAQVLGCQPFPKFNGPPPLFKGIIPYVSFSVPSIVDYTGFNTETKFERPVASINKAKGSTIIGGILIPLELSQDQKDNCIEEANGNKNCAQIKSGEPDKINITQNGIALGKYRRPAIEQKDDSGISFFPCYHTYDNPNYSDPDTKKAYQGVFIFSINRGVNKEIGTFDGQRIALDINYMPVSKIQKTPSGCDLCVNAAKQNQSDWADNLYQKLKDSDAKECILDQGVEIKMVKLVDESGNERLYPFKDPCNPTSDPRGKAPLRVNMYDEDEQKVFWPCNDNKFYSYAYNSESAFIDKQLVKVRPVIPALDDQGEAKFEQAYTMSNEKKCRLYDIDSANGSIFITPEGLRDRSKCFQGGDSNNMYTLCGNGPAVDDINKSTCPGIYQGSKIEYKKDDPITMVPNKICIMTDSIWDFISGRYQVTYIKNLNKDNKIVPRMACTNLPDCTSMGTKTINNIGNAIWDKTAKFNESVEGSCDEPNYYYRVDIDSYKINSDAFTDSNIRSNLENALNTLKTKIQDRKKNNEFIPYLMESHLDGALKEAYDEAKKNDQKLFTCPQKIKPDGTCIGGIYGIDTKLLRNNNTDENNKTSCINAKEFASPVDCE